MGAVGLGGSRDAGVQGGPQQDEVGAAGEPAAEREMEQGVLAAQLLEPGAVEIGGGGVDEQTARAGNLLVAVAVGRGRTLQIFYILTFQANDAGNAIKIYEVDPGVPGRAVVQ